MLENIALRRIVEAAAAAGIAAYAHAAEKAPEAPSPYKFFWARAMSRSGRRRCQTSDIVMASPFGSKNSLASHKVLFTAHSVKTKLIQGKNCLQGEFQGFFISAMQKGKL